MKISTTQASLPKVIKKGLIKNGLVKKGTFKKYSSLLCGAVLLSPVATAHEAEDIYPTHVIADYVLACMAANGNSFASLHQCSCSIDVIMSKISYEDYEKATTILQVQLDRGQRGIFYRDSSWAKNKLDEFERVQAESTLKCF